MRNKGWEAWISNFRKLPSYDSLLKPIDELSLSHTLIELYVEVVNLKRVTDIIGVAETHWCENNPQIRQHYDGISMFLYASCALFLWISLLHISIQRGQNFGYGQIQILLPVCSILQSLERPEMLLNENRGNAFALIKRSTKNHFSSLVLHVNNSALINALLVSQENTSGNT